MKVRMTLRAYLMGLLQPLFAVVAAAQALLDGKLTALTARVPNGSGGTAHAAYGGATLTPLLSEGALQTYELTAATVTLAAPTLVSGVSRAELALYVTTTHAPSTTLLLDGGLTLALGSDGLVVQPGQVYRVRLISTGGATYVETKRIA